MSTTATGFPPTKKHPIILKPSSFHRADSFRGKNTDKFTLSEQEHCCSSTNDSWCYIPLRVTKFWRLPTQGETNHINNFQQSSQHAFRAVKETKFKSSTTLAVTPSWAAVNLFVGALTPEITVTINRGFLNAPVAIF